MGHLLMYCYTTVLVALIPPSWSICVFSEGYSSLPYFNLFSLSLTRAEHLPPTTSAHLRFYHLVQPNRNRERVTSDPVVLSGSFCSLASRTLRDWYLLWMPFSWVGPLLFSCSRQNSLRKPRQDRPLLYTLSDIILWHLLRKDFHSRTSFACTTAMLAGDSV